MTAWANLLAASALPSGTAWALLTNPKQGGLVVNDGVAVEVVDMQVAVEVMLEPVEATIEDNQIVVELDDVGIGAEVVE